MLFCSTFSSLTAQIPTAVKKIMAEPYMKDATFALQVKDMDNGKVIYHYNEDRLLAPASVLKTVSTATALDILGGDYRYPTRIEYDGEVADGVLKGNLYIKGSGDPSLGSSYFPGDREAFLKDWCNAVKQAGIREIKGAVIADEQIFDTEGVCPKWTRENMGNYFAAGCFGLSVFDNAYKIFFTTGPVGSKVKIDGTEPKMDEHLIRFHNYLKVTPAKYDSTYILGVPYMADRFIYGFVPANKTRLAVKGDIPDPALFLSTLLDKSLKKEGIKITGRPSTHRIETEALRWKQLPRKEIITTYSPELSEIARVCNHVSHNLYADALIKTVGIRYKKGKNEVINSFEKGIKVAAAHWKSKGIDIEPYQVYDGCGLAAANQVSAAFINDILIYMATQSKSAESFKKSLPVGGENGSVASFLKNTPLKGKVHLKSGSINGVRNYAGYVNKDGHHYVFSVFTNNYEGSLWRMDRRLEKLLVELF